MLSKNTRIAKLYTVLTKPTHKRKKKDLRLCVSMLGKYLEECLNQSRSLPMNNPTLLKQLCRFDLCLYIHLLKKQKMTIGCIKI